LVGTVRVSLIRGRSLTRGSENRWCLETPKALLFLVRRDGTTPRDLNPNQATMRRPTADGLGTPVFQFSGVASGDTGGREAGGKQDANPPHANPTRMAHRAVASDVTLQMLLQNNVFFSIAWWCATVISTFVKTNGAYEDTDDIRPVMLAMYTIFEPTRLYCGYAGNLQEKVPLLWGFVALTAIVQLPLAAFFWFGQGEVTAFDKALNTVFGLLLLAEVFVGIVASGKVLRNQKLAFFEGEGRRTATPRL
jgi:transmembrane protein 17